MRPNVQGILVKYLPLGCNSYVCPDYPIAGNLLFFVHMLGSEAAFLNPQCFACDYASVNTSLCCIELVIRVGMERRMRQNLAYTRDERKPFLQNRFTRRDLRKSILPNTKIVQVLQNRFSKIDLPKPILQNRFTKINSPKSILQNRFTKINSPKSILQNRFC